MQECIQGMAGAGGTGGIDGYTSLSQEISLHPASSVVCLADAGVDWEQCSSRSPSLDSQNRQNNVRRSTEVSFKRCIISDLMYYYD